jgi:hypothetical protein
MSAAEHEARVKAVRPFTHFIFPLGLIPLIHRADSLRYWVANGVSFLHALSGLQAVNS